MKPIDIWHEELRKYGVTQKALDDGAEYADKHNPFAAKLMREEVPDYIIPIFRKLLADMAEELYAKPLRDKQ